MTNDDTLAAALAERRLPIGRRLSPRSLRFRFVAAISILVAVVLASLATVLALTSRQELRRDIEQRGESHAALAVGPICEAFETYYTSGYTKFRELVTDVASLNPDLAGLAIYDTTGRKLFDSEEFDRELFQPGEKPPVRATEPRLLGAVKGLEIESWTGKAEEGSQGEESYRIVVPYVEEWGRHRYSVVFDISYASLYEATRAAAVRLSWLTAASLLLGVVIAMILARQSLGPLEQLIQGARDLGEGNLDRRLALQTGDEFEILARTFNHMAARLSASIADLEASNVALQQSNVELKEMDRLKSDLLANVSHELRTPLTSVRGYLEAMGEELLGPLTEGQREAVEVSERNLDRLLDMIEELLSFSRFESGQVKLALRPCDLGEVGRQVAGAIRASRGPELKLALSVPEDLPPVVADPHRIAQVLDNLLTNAVKFTAEGDPIELRMVPEGEQVLVEVEDSGIGIPEAERQRIFDRFYQVESSSTRKFGGIGLGLSIVRQILDAHGSAVEVTSEVGEGTTFRFRLPVAAEESDRPSSGRRVAIVDDDASFARQLAGGLEASGFTVRTASSCRGAASLVADFRPRVVVLDRLLPDGDGFDLLADWTERFPAMGVLVVSVRHDEALARRLGADGYCVKPVEIDDIRRKIESIAGEDRRGSSVAIVGSGDEILLAAVTAALEARGLDVRLAGGWAETDGDGDVVVITGETASPDRAAAIDRHRAPRVVLVGGFGVEEIEAWESVAVVEAVITDEGETEEIASSIEQRVISERKSA